MAAFEILTRTDLGRYRFSVDLTDVIFVFSFAFNRRDSHWYFDLIDAEGNAIRQGVKVTANWLLLRQLIQQGRPDGVLLAVDPQGNLEPGLEDLGDQVKFTYVDGS